MPEVINVGAAPNDGEGDVLRDAFGKVNTNFAAIDAVFKTNPTTFSTLVGVIAGQGGTATDRTMVGDRAGAGATGKGTCIGSNAGRDCLSNSVTAVGEGAARNATGNSLTAFGLRAALNSSTAASFFLGDDAGRESTAGTGVIAIGESSGRGNSGANCVFIGREAGRDNSTAARLEIVQRNINTTPLIEGNFSTNVVTMRASAMAALAADPADPPDGRTVQWVSDGTGSGDAGDVMMKINVGGTTKTVTLVDFSEV